MVQSSDDSHNILIQLLNLPDVRQVQDYSYLNASMGFLLATPQV
jgi:hypothetical protein